MKYSVIIPVYNEEKVIVGCLESLNGQTVVDQMEVIVVDDGSTDRSLRFVQSTQKKLPGLKLTALEISHGGPGAARNLGVGKARGKILVFVDADMEFAPDFIEKLTEPISNGQAIGTFSLEEYLLNGNKPVARCWNYHFGGTKERMKASDTSARRRGLSAKAKSFLEMIEGMKAGESQETNRGHVFRAILRAEFERAGGFDTEVGYTDDWTLSRKLGTLALATDEARFYHRNPESWPEVWRQARWYGKNEFLTRTLIRRLFNLFRFCPLLGVVYGLSGALKYQELTFAPFELVFSTAVFVSILGSFAGENKAK